MPATDPGIRLLTPPPPAAADILSPAALGFLAALARRFEPERQRLLARRRLLGPLVDAEYGSATFVAATRPATFEVRVSTTGLLARPVRE